MQQRKQREADRRSVELKEASQKKVAETEKNRRAGMMQFSSELSNGCVPSARSEPRLGSKMCTGSKLALSTEASAAGAAASGPSASGGAVAAGCAGAADSSGSGSEVEEELGGTQRPYCGDGVCRLGCERVGDGEGPTARSADGALLSDSSTVHPSSRESWWRERENEHSPSEYEDDFVDDDDNDYSYDGRREEAAGRLSHHPVVRAARIQAEARSLEQQQAQQQRLVVLAREQLHVGSERPPAVATAGAARGAAGGAAAADEVPEELPIGGTALQAFGGMRHAALQERCRQALGDLFPPVYAYLRQARSEEADEKDVRKKLLLLVGQGRLNDCMCVDELVFTESVGL